MAQAATEAQPTAYAGTLISAESYLTEPADLWQQALPAPWRDRGPRVTRGARGDQFEVDGVAPRPLGLPAPLTQLSRIGVGVGGGYAAYGYQPAPQDRDGAARLAWQRAAGLAAEVLYPTLGLLVTTSPDAQLQQLCCRVYNDWLAAFCAADRTRLKGMALLPARAEMADIVAEIEHAAALGLAGVVLPARHAVTPYNMPAWDAAFAREARLLSSLRHAALPVVSDYFAEHAWGNTTLDDLVRSLEHGGLGLHEGDELLGLVVEVVDHLRSRGGVEIGVPAQHGEGGAEEETGRDEKAGGGHGLNWSGSASQLLRR